MHPSPCLNPNPLRTRLVRAVFLAVALLCAACGDDAPQTAPDANTAPDADTSDATDDAAPEDTSADASSPPQDVAPEDAAPDTPLDAPQPSDTAPDAPLPDATPDTSSDDATPDTAPPDPLPLQRHPIHDPDARSALCNDGSPAAWYGRPGQGDGRDRWVIVLQGGDMCATESMCASRWQRVPRLMSSTSQTDTLGVGGILNPDPDVNPAFWDANHVFVPYCSSDFWIGQRTADDVSGGWNFYGAHIVDALIQDLRDAPPPDFPDITSAEWVVFAGVSAGGAGVMAHLNRVTEALAPAPVRGLNDGGWALDVDPYGDALDPGLAATYALGFWEGRIDAACSAQQIFNGLCLFADHAAPHFTAPVFVHINQNDAIQWNALGLTAPFDPDEQAYALDYQARLRASLYQHASGAISPLNGTHTTLEYSAFHSLTLDGVSMHDAVDRWLRALPEPLHLVEAP